jgi:hypothetical protein
MRVKNLAAAGTALIVLTLGAAPFLASAADHLDAPIVKNNHALDITDIYAFDGANSRNTVLVLDVAPLAGVLSGTQFSTSGSYRMNLDTNGDYVADTVYTTTFSAGGRDHKQAVTVKRNGTTIAAGYTGNAIMVNGGGKVYAGKRDDPFFFDLAGYNQLKDSGYTDPSGLTDSPGTDFFAGTNILTIVLELPDSAIGASANYWATTYSGSTLIDRMGKPALNTVFIDPFKVDANTKDDYNQTSPADDVATWKTQFVGVLEFFGNGSGTANAIAGLLLPDVLHLDTANLGKSTGTSFTGDKAGHILNGRTLAEDVIDFELFVVTGGLEGHAILSTDHVNSNDVAFPGDFPYLASAH